MKNFTNWFGRTGRSGAAKFETRLFKEQSVFFLRSFNVNTTHLFSAARLIATHALPSELRDAGIIPAVGQAAGEMPSLISLFDSGMGAAILPASAVRPSVAPVVTYEIADKRPMSEIAITVGKGNRTPVVNNFRSLALEKLPTFPQKC